MGSECDVIGPMYSSNDRTTGIAGEGTGVGGHGGGSRWLKETRSLRSKHRRHGAVGDSWLDVLSKHHALAWVSGGVVGVEVVVATTAEALG